MKVTFELTAEEPAINFLVMDGDDEETGKSLSLQPGETGTLEVDIAAGEYLQPAEPEEAEEGEGEEASEEGEESSEEQAA